MLVISMTLSILNGPSWYLHINMLWLKAWTCSKRFAYESELLFGPWNQHKYFCLGPSPTFMFKGHILQYFPDITNIVKGNESLADTAIYMEIVFGVTLVFSSLSTKSTICFKWQLLLHPWANFSQNFTWPTSWKSILNFFSWAEMPVDLKLDKKCQGD